METLNLDNLDAAQYKQYRIDSFAKLADMKMEPYPHKFHVSISISDFIEKYKDIEVGQTLEEEVSLAGTYLGICLIITNFKNN